MRWARLCVYNRDAFFPAFNLQEGLNLFTLFVPLRYQRQLTRILIVYYLCSASASPLPGSGFVVEYPLALSNFVL